MDPPPVLGLATDVVQFAHFASQKCRSVLTLYQTEHGSRFQEIAFERAAADFSQFSALLKQKRKFHHRLSRSVDVNERVIGKLAGECSCVAKELSIIFNKFSDIHKKDEANSTALASMRAAWKSEDITHLIDQMQAYQNQVAQRLLLYLNATIGIANGNKRQRAETPESDNPKIVEVLAVSENKLDLIALQGSSRRKRTNEAETSGIIHHEKTLAAALTLQNGDIEVLASSETPHPSYEKAPQTLLTLRTETAPGENCVSIQDFKPVQDMVLRSLYFRSYSDRVESLKPRHKLTFEWVFQSPQTDKPRRTPLKAWLEEGHGCFWINGHAGSGKSTLMNFILNDYRTKKALKKWAHKGDLELVTADFFFWSLGSRLQRSQHGLLRSLLYSILLKRPHLISVVVPELWSASASKKQDGTTGAPSFSELLQWFRRLLEVATTKYRLFFLIDGLDEYEGDFFNLTELIKSASTNENVKFLVSSRPNPAFVDTFSSLPGFRLHDLTHGDIYKYSMDHLRKPLQSRDETDWESIIDQIVKKSGGVFLWVILLIKSLESGLVKWNTLAELRGRLNELPSELKGLHASMLNRMQRADRRKAAEFFQIALLALDTQSVKSPLTPLQMHFATLDDSAVIQAPIETIPIQEEKMLSNIIKGKLRFQCAGLLEVQSVNYRMEGLLTPSIFKHQIVGFAHRTTVEFLRLPEIWDVLLRLTEAIPFHPVSSLCRSSIMLCKTAPVENTIQIDESPLWYFMDNAMRLASIAEHDKHCVSPECIQELDRALSHKWEKASRCSYGSHRQSTKGTHWTSAYKLGSDNVEYNKDHIAVLLAPAAAPLCFHSLAVFHCLTDFVANVRASTESGPSASEASRVLHDATRNMLYDHPWSEPNGMTLRCAKICELLLTQGADPNAKSGRLQESAWDLMLKFGVKQLAKKPEFRKQFQRQGIAYHFSKLLVVFVKHNANVNDAVLQPDTRTDKRAMGGEKYYSAFKVIDLLFSDGEVVDGVPEPFSPSYYSEAEAHNPEMVMIYDNLKKMMSQKGAVAEAYSESKEMQWQAPDKHQNSKWWDKVKEVKRRSLGVVLRKR